MKFLFSWLPVLCFSWPIFSLTLNEAYENALSNRSEVLNARLEQEIARYARNQSISEVLPKLRVFSTSTWQDQVTGTGTQRSFGEKYQHTAALEATQDVFQGGNEVFALRAANQLQELAKWNKENSQLQLYESVSSLFFSLLEAHLIEQNLSEQIRLLSERLALLNRRAEIGRSKSTDVISAQSGLARIQAQQLQNRSEIIQTTRLLEALTGITPLPPLRDDFSKERITNSPAGSVSQSPLLRSSSAQVELAQIQKTGALTNFLPTVSATGRYYLDRDGILADSKWDVGLTAEWEFFSGGASYTERRKRSLQHLQEQNRHTDLQTDLQKRFRAEEDKFEVQRKTFLALQKSADLAQQNYAAYQEEFRNGLVSNLDVLQALDLLLDARQERDRASIELKRSWVTLHLLLGRTP